MYNRQTICITGQQGHSIRTKQQRNQGTKNNGTIVHWECGWEPGCGQNCECGQHILIEAHQAVNRIAEPKFKSELELKANWNCKTNKNSDDREHRIENWYQEHRQPWECRWNENMDNGF